MILLFLFVKIFGIIIEQNRQFGNFMIFLSLRFYVKSILGILEVQNLPFQNIQRHGLFTSVFLKFRQINLSNQQILTEDEYGGRFAYDLFWIALYRYFLLLFWKKSKQRFHKIKDLFTQVRISEFEWKFDTPPTFRPSIHYQWYNYNLKAKF